MTQTKTRTSPATEFSLDAAADAVVDIAMRKADWTLTRDQRDQLRTQIQAAVDALVDECRDYYTRLANDQVGVQVHRMRAIVEGVAQQLTTDQSLCHVGLVPAPACCRCGPILQARAILADLDPSAPLPSTGVPPGGTGK